MEIIFSLENIQQAAQQFLQAIADKKVIALHGQMGAGKTTFVQALCQELHVNSNISSPTFSIINSYSTKEGNTIYHIDLYRLKSESEAIQAGVEDCLYSGNICLVEWPEITPNLFPEDTVHCNLEVLGSQIGASPNPSEGGELPMRRLTIKNLL
jgi:tRNA threonylcarbamoyladenosine biosynthesis protein TsaE